MASNDPPQDITKDEPSTPQESLSQQQPKEASPPPMTTENASQQNPPAADAAQPTTDAAPEESSEQKIPVPTQEPTSPAPDASAKEAEVEESGPSLTITLLLITGARHPFKIDGKYLRKQGVNVENYDPFTMSVYTLKELIWRAWRQDWETRPTSPSSIRLISFGKLLDDKSPLADSKFSRDAPNVVHMTVKPQELADEEDTKGSKAQLGRERDSSERSPSCRCVIM